jgi:hypothetical protein
MEIQDPFDYGRSLERPISARRVTLLCNQGRVQGAKQLPGGHWVIPKGAEILPPVKRPKRDRSAA